MEIEFQKRWDELQRKINHRFNQDLDVQAILFIIGLQELGQKVESLTKNQKVDVMHIAVCTLLEPYGYYKYEGRDKDGWPHWEALEELPRLNNQEQEQLIKQGIIEYLEPTL